MTRAGRALPVYLQLAEEFRQKILNGDYAPNELLPSETELVKEKRLSRITVRNAMALLADEGLVEKVQGKGTFVSTPTVAQNFLGFHDFARDMRQRGSVPSFRIVRYSLEKIPKTLQPVLGQGAAATVHSIHRVKLADGIPLMYERLFLPTDLIPEIAGEDLHTMWLTQLLPERFGLHLARARKAVQPIVIGDEAARHLQVPARSLGLLVDRISWAHEVDDRPILVTRSIVRGDVARFSVDLNSDGGERY